MIVRCERCETRFKLDESRIPARGARVRCSRCKHAFFVMPPGATREDALHAAAAAAAAAPEEAGRAPEPSWDLDDAPGVTVARPKPAAPASEAPSAEPEESEWRFEDEAPGLDAAAARAALDVSGTPAAPLAAAPDPNEDSFASLGDPETWDLLADAPPTPGPAAAPEPAPTAAAPSAAAPPAAPASPASVQPHPKPVAAPAAPRSAAPLASAAPAPGALVTARRIPQAPRPSAAAAWAGWVGLVALVAAIAWGALLRPLAPSAARSAALGPVAGFEVREVRARLVENAAGGALLVVSGTLHNPGPSARPLGAPLEVRLLDAHGEPLAHEAAHAGPALAERDLREAAPEQLVAAQEAAAARLARTPVAPGDALAFAAVFAPVPREASRFVLGAGSASR
ncbi:MAG TPA: zinc-ribbon domain-containing protein [Myxococcota bacterium]